MFHVSRLEVVPAISRANHICCQFHSNTQAKLFLKLLPHQSDNPGYPSTEDHLPRLNIVDCRPAPFSSSMDRQEVPLFRVITPAIPSETHSVSFRQRPSPWGDHGALDRDTPTQMLDLYDLNRPSTIDRPVEDPLSVLDLI